MRRAIVVGVLVLSGLGVLSASDDPPAVMLDLGPVVPTPAPTPAAATRKRLITTLTVQNVAGGESVMNFECTDVAEQEHGKFHTLAASRYSLSNDSTKLRAQRAKIIAKIRDLEYDLLEYAKIAGPPKERKPLLAPPDTPSKSEGTE